MATPRFCILLCRFIIYFSENFFQSYFDLQKYCFWKQKCIIRQQMFFSQFDPFKKKWHKVDQKLCKNWTITLNGLIFSPLVFWLWAPDGLSSNSVDVDFLTYIAFWIFKPNFCRSKRDPNLLLKKNLYLHIILQKT